EDRASADGVNAEEVAPVIVSGHHHFIAAADLDRPQRQLDRECPAAAGENVIDVVHLRKPSLQPSHMSALIAPPRTVAVRRLPGLANSFIGDRPIRWPLRPDRLAAQDRWQGIISGHGAVPDGGMDFPSNWQFHFGHYIA